MDCRRDVYIPVQPAERRVVLLRRVEVQAERRVVLLRRVEVQAEGGWCCSDVWRFRRRAGGAAQTCGGSGGGRVVTEERGRCYRVCCVWRPCYQPADK